MQLDVFSAETLQEWLKHLGEIWSAVFLVDGGGVANDINDAAELHHAAEQAGVWNRVLWFCMLITASPNHMSSYMFGVIRIFLTMINLKSRYQVIHEAFSTGRNHQVLRGCVVHLKWSMVWRWRAQDFRLHCWRCHCLLPGAATGQEECWSWRRSGWIQSKRQSIAT